LSLSLYVLQKGLRPRMQQISLQYFLARSAKLPTGLYISPSVISFFLSFLMIYRKTIISGSAGPIFEIFSPNESVLSADERSGPLFPISQGTLPWQLILWKNGKLWRIRGDNYANIRVERPLLFASAFDNELANRKSAFKRFNGNNQATLCPAWWTPSNNLGVCAVKTRNVSCESPAIWRRSSFVKLAFSNGLEDRNFDFSIVIGNHFCTPCRNLVKFGSVTPEFKK